MTTSSAPPGVRLEMYRNILRYFRSYAGPLARWVLTPILVVRLFLLTRSSMAFRLFTLEPGNWQA